MLSLLLRRRSSGLSFHTAWTHSGSQGAVDAYLNKWQSCWFQPAQKTGRFWYTATLDAFWTMVFEVRRQSLAGNFLERLLYLFPHIIVRWHGREGGNCGFRGRADLSQAYRSILPHQ